MAFVLTLPLEGAQRFILLLRIPGLRGLFGAVCVRMPGYGIRLYFS